MTIGSGETHKSRPVLSGGPHERDKENEFQHRDGRPHSNS
jgi:hypothetical protein